ncbi:MAG: hypothetical protein HY048_20540 [Acidobacteria bacterium]|nr:hypothetical protein [Acidobacteriota bacterium]
MPRRLSILVCLLATLVPAGLGGQTRQSVAIHVKETAGIRRSAYPLNARVALRAGALRDASHARLMISGAEAPVQLGVESSWPDGSIRSLTVDFNASVGPGEEMTAQLEYGDEVTASAVARGLSVTETPDAIQVGNARFNKSLAPLLLSIKYRQEDIGQGLNGVALIDTAGASHDASDVDALKVDVLKRGPLYVAIRYSGRIAVGEARVPITVDAEMPNSKTWLKVTTTVDDPGRRVRELSFHTPLAFSAFPRTWDFGTGSWSYGFFRTAPEIATLTQTVGPASSSWLIRSGAKGQETIAERASGSRPAVAEGWGHIQDAKEAVAFAIGGFGEQPGTYTMSVDGDGQASYRFAPAQPQTRLGLTVYQHFVATPVPVGAATSPVAMLHPLVVTVQ